MPYVIVMLQSLILLNLVGCQDDGQNSGSQLSDVVPQRIVSLDYCADQYVLKLANRSNILALSPDAKTAFSYLRQRADGLPQVRPMAENIIALKPDLVVRSYGGGATIESFLARADIRVITIGWVSELYGDSNESIPGVTRKIAGALGETARGEAVVRDYLERLDRVRRRSQTRGELLYLSAAGATSGPGSLIDKMLGAAGFTNFVSEAGWQSIPLEKLAYEQPVAVAAAFFDDGKNHKNFWSPSRHPIAVSLREQLPIANLEGASTACGAWFLADAVEALGAIVL